MTLGYRRSMIVLALAACGAGSAAAQGAPNPPPARQSPTLLSALTERCPQQELPAEPAGGPLMMVTPLGEILRMRGRMNEGDSLQVVVVGPAILLNRLTITRTSNTRVRGAVNVAGQTGFARTATACASATWVLREFAPGIGEFEISALWPTGKENDPVGYTTQSLAKPTFPVGTLYRGALFVGVVGTALRNPAYGVRVNPADSTDTTLAYTTRPGGRLEYAVFYTHFLSRPRDIETDLKLRLDLAFGLVLNDIPNNLLAGLTAHVGYSFYLVAGGHLGRVQRLDDHSSLRVGDRITGGAGAIPVDKRYALSWFVGGGLDLRAAGRLFGLLSK